MKIYVGCGLTHAPESFKKAVQQLKEALKSVSNLVVLEFLGLENGTARDVFIHDIGCVSKCDLMIAICDEPSIGLGVEMGIQMQTGKPILAFGHESSKITRLILDPPIDNFKFHRYKNFNDIYEIVLDFVKNHKNS